MGIGHIEREIGEDYAQKLRDDVDYKELMGEAKAYRARNPREEQPTNIRDDGASTPAMGWADKDLDRLEEADTIPQPPYSNKVRRPVGRKAGRRKVIGAADYLIRRLDKYEKKHPPVWHTPHTIRALGIHP